MKEVDFSSLELVDEFIVKRGEWKVEDGPLAAREIASQHHAASCHLMPELLLDSNQNRLVSTN
ncbi:MAG: hypothetical protein OSA89_09390 [Mariniblastus sp.]|nr:hypothetical protein [Mariniblastus sp.]